MIACWIFAPLTVVLSVASPGPMDGYIACIAIENSECILWQMLVSTPFSVVTAEKTHVGVDVCEDVFEHA
jgi:hypothetical protein